MCGFFVGFGLSPIYTHLVRHAGGTDANGLELLPTLYTQQVIGTGIGILPTFFQLTMSFVSRLMSPHGNAGEIVFQVLFKIIPELLEQGGLVSLVGQNIVGLGASTLFGNRRLATQGINHNQGALDL